MECDEMCEHKWLAARFEDNRHHLRAVAYKMLGSATEADDAVQECWLRLSRSGATGVENISGWLTTVVSRICLDMLRSRQSRREVPMPADEPGPWASSTSSIGPEADMLLADSIGPALLVILETLAPAERVAFVLHDLFDLSFEEIALIVGRSPVAARQLASRARRRVRGGAAIANGDLARHREVIDAFFAASREGRFDTLLEVLSPNVVLRADDVAVQVAATNRWGGDGAPQLSNETHGARAVAETFKNRARGAQPALIDGDAGAVWAFDGRPRAAFVFAIEFDKIVEIELVMDPERLGQLELRIGQNVAPLRKTKRR
jgi:RNA polymerase sigma factor (sigma-70 family)